MKQLRSPSGKTIIGTIDVIEGVAVLDGWEVVRPSDENEPVKELCDGHLLAPQYNGETDVDWDSQKPKMRCGQILVVDEDCGIFPINECTVFDDDDE